MKHFFFVHSHIVRAVAEGYVKYAGLPKSDCLFYLTRGLENYAKPLPGSIETRSLPNPIFGKVSQGINNWRTFRQNAETISGWMQQQPFTTYTPNPTLPVSQQLIHHPQCRGYWILEEGIGSYLERGTTSVDRDLAAMSFKFFRQLKTNFFGMGFIRSVNHFGQVWPRKYLGTIAAYSDCFPGYPGKKVVLSAPIFRRYESPTFKHLLIMESGVGAGADPERAGRSYIAALRGIISKVKSIYPGGWAWKFHPYDLENPDWIKSVREFMYQCAGPPAPQELLPKTCLEELGICPGVTTYGSSSSAIIYISRGGGEVVNISSALRQCDALLLPDYESIPSHLRIGTPFDHYIKQTVADLGMG